jgi:hypothetical protein
LRNNFPESAAWRHDARDWAARQLLGFLLGFTRIKLPRWLNYLHTSCRRAIAKFGEKTIGSLGPKEPRAGSGNDARRGATGALNDALKPGTAGLFLLIRKMTTDKEDLKGIGGRGNPNLVRSRQGERAKSRARRSCPSTRADHARG